MLPAPSDSIITLKGGTNQLFQTFPCFWTQPRSCRLPTIGAGRCGFLSEAQRAARGEREPKDRRQIPLQKQKRSASLSGRSTSFLNFGQNLTDRKGTTDWLMNKAIANSENGEPVSLILAEIMGSSLRNVPKSIKYVPNDSSLSAEKNLGIRSKPNRSNLELPGDFWYNV